MLFALRNYGYSFHHVCGIMGHIFSDMCGIMGPSCVYTDVHEDWIAITMRSLVRIAQSYEAKKHEQPSQRKVGMIISG